MNLFHKVEANEAHEPVMSFHGSASNEDSEVPLSRDRTQNVNTKIKKISLP